MSGSEMVLFTYVTNKQEQVEPNVCRCVQVYMA